jgi:hypothetical protein
LELEAKQSWGFFCASKWTFCFQWKIGSFGCWGLKVVWLFGCIGGLELTLCRFEPIEINPYFFFFFFIVCYFLYEQCTTNNELRKQKWTRLYLFESCFSVDDVVNCSACCVFQVVWFKPPTCRYPTTLHCFQTLSAPARPSCPPLKPWLDSTPLPSWAWPCPTYTENQSVRVRACVLVSVCALVGLIHVHSLSPSTSSPHVIYCPLLLVSNT